MRASRNGHVEIVRALLAAGADVNASGNDRDTALMAASNRGHREIVKELIMSGARHGQPRRKSEKASFLVIGPWR